MPGKIDGTGIAATAAGAILIYSGSKGFSILKATQNLISGKPVSDGQSDSLLMADAKDGSSSGNGSASGSAPPAKGSYDHAGLMKLWQQAGGNPAGANNAACHGMQESAGSPKATSANPDGGTNVGLWQLDTPGGKGAGHTIAQLQDPFTNAKITVKATNNGRDWSAWATPGC